MVAHRGDQGISEVDFSIFSTHLQILSDLLILLHTGVTKVWSDQGELSRYKTDIEMSPLE